MPKPTNTQELTARYLAAGAGFKQEEQFFALLNAASHVAKPFGDTDDRFYEMCLADNKFDDAFEDGTTLEPLADDKAPF